MGRTLATRSRKLHFWTSNFGLLGPTSAPQVWPFKRSYNPRRYPSASDWRPRRAEFRGWQAGQFSRGLCSFFARYLKRRNFVDSCRIQESVQEGASRLWWSWFVEKVSFEPGMKQWKCDGGWEWWAGARYSKIWCDSGNEGCQRVSKDVISLRPADSVHYRSPVRP